ncbi:MAG: hypothetical protein R3245_08300 [Kiloniellales bacterium]|nr:hypothetical protein [Kiloniellales bacterium]
MTRFHLLFVGGLFFAVLCNLTWPLAVFAAKDLGDRPKVVAKAFGELAPKATLAVRYDEMSDLNVWIRATMINYLKARGYVIDENAKLVLTFRSELRTDSRDGSRFSLEANKNRSSDDTFFLDYNVPLGERPGPAASSYFAISATLGETGERAIWHGTSSARTTHRRNVELQPLVVTALINALGETVGQETFY